MFLIAPMIAVSMAPPAPPATTCEITPPTLRLPDWAAATPASLPGRVAAVAERLDDHALGCLVAASEAESRAAAAQTDEAFVAAGIGVGDAAEVWSSDIVVKVNAPTAEEIGRLIDVALDELADELERMGRDGF